MSDLERRLEELFADDARSRRVARIDVRTRRRSPLATAGAFAALAVFAVAAGLGLGALREQLDAARPEPVATALPSATAAPGASPSPAGSHTYSSPHGYSVQLPDGWRRSDRVSYDRPVAGGDQDALIADVFTIRTPEDELRAIAATHVGLGPAQSYTAYVRIDRNSRALSPRAFAEREQGKFGLAAVAIEEITVQGGVGAKVTWRYTADDPQRFYALYLPDEARRIWVIGFYLAPRGAEIPAGATEAGVRSIVETFRFTDRATAPVATASPGTTPPSPFGVVSAVWPTQGQEGLYLRDERDRRPFARLAPAIGLTSDARVAGAVSPDGRRYAFWAPAQDVTEPRVGQSRTLHLWDAAEPFAVSQLLDASADEHGDGVAWSSDGTGLLLSFRSTDLQAGTPVRPRVGMVRSYDLASRRLEPVAQDSGGALLPLVWDRARATVAFFGVVGERATVYSVVRPSGTATTTTLTNARRLSASADGAWIVAEIDDGRSAALRAWPVDDPARAVEQVPRHAAMTLTHIGWRPGTHEVAFSEHARVRTGFTPSQLTLWDVGAGRRRDIGDASTVPIAFRADGAAVYLATADLPVRYVVLELASGTREDLPVMHEREAMVAGVRLRR